MPNHQHKLAYLINNGIKAGKSGDTDQAIKHLTQALQLDPNEPITLFNLGYAHQQKKDYSKSISFFLSALKQSPNDPLILFSLGSALQESNQFRQAIKYYRQCLSLDPVYAQAHANLGAIYIKLYQPAKAINHLQTAINLNPNLTKAQYNLGNAYYLNGQSKLSISAYRQAIIQNPNYLKAYNNLSAVLLQQNQKNEAIKVLQQAIKLNPAQATLYLNLGNIIRDTDHIDQAIACYQEAIRLQPKFPDTYSYLYSQLRVIFDWSQIKKIDPEITKLTNQALELDYAPGETPFINLSRTDNLDTNFRLAHAWSHRIQIASKPLHSGFNFSHLKSSTKINLGYLSADFVNHPVAHHIHPVFQFHDRSKFNVFAFSFGQPDQSTFRQQIKTNADHFIELSDPHPANASKTIHQNHIHILIDLMGYTKNSQLEIPSLRPAPIQISYLGFPGTTGANFIDYIITDPLITPPNTQKYYSEKFIYLPHAYQLNTKLQVSKQAQSRKKLNLPPQGIIFAAFNKIAKITPSIFSIWMKLLHHAPGSVLWLWVPPHQATTINNLRQTAQKHKINPNRLIFTTKVPIDQHLKRLQLADICLDTHLYSGGATTANAIQANIPTITLTGKHYLSRMSTSLLTSVGLPELVTHTHQDYFQLALYLAHHPKKLQHIKAKIYHNNSTYPLFQTQRFISHLESAYQKTWQNYLSGKQPQPFHISDLKPLNSFYS